MSTSYETKLAKYHRALGRADGLAHAAAYLVNHKTTLSEAAAHFATESQAHPRRPARPPVQLNNTDETQAKEQNNG